MGSMINAAMVGLGWWGKTLVESVQGTSDEISVRGGGVAHASPTTIGPLRRRTG